MTPDRLAEIKARVEAASPGPWRPGMPCDSFCSCHGPTCHNVWAEGGADITSPCAGLSREDAAFIAGARQDVPDLLEGLAVADEQIRAAADRAQRFRDVLLRIAARGGDWSYPCLLAHIADALGMKVTELERQLREDG